MANTAHRYVTEYTSQLYHFPESIYCGMPTCLAAELLTASPGEFITIRDLLLWACSLKEREINMMKTAFGIAQTLHVGLKTMGSIWDAVQTEGLKIVIVV